MNTEQISADYHLYKRQLDEAKQRIAELEQELHYAKQAARVEADMYDQARAAMKQLREDLQVLSQIVKALQGIT